MRPLSSEVSPSKNPNVGLHRVPHQLVLDLLQHYQILVRLFHLENNSSHVITLVLQIQYYLCRMWVPPPPFCFIEKAWMHVVAELIELSIVPANSTDFPNFSAAPAPTLANQLEQSSKVIMMSLNNIHIIRLVTS